MGIHPSLVVITKLKLDEDCKKMLKPKVKSYHIEKEKGKYKEETDENMQE